MIFASTVDAADLKTDGSISSDDSVFETSDIVSAIPLYSQKKDCDMEMNRHFEVKGEGGGNERTDCRTLIKLNDKFD